MNLIFCLYVFVDWLSFLCFFFPLFAPRLVLLPWCSDNHRSAWFSMSARSLSYVTAVYQTVVCKSFHFIVYLILFGGADRFGFSAKTKNKKTIKKTKSFSHNLLDYMT